jgi:hypothetical protein
MMEFATAACSAGSTAAILACKLTLSMMVLAERLDCSTNEIVASLGNWDSELPDRSLAKSVRDKVIESAMMHSFDFQDNCSDATVSWLAPPQRYVGGTNYYAIAEHELSWTTKLFFVGGHP